jgi:ribosomal protein S18 acetylase RimI-like enzyme
MGSMEGCLSPPTDELRAFMREHCCADHALETLEAIVSALADDRILVVRQAGVVALAGCLIRDLANPDGASELVLLACRTGDSLPLALAVLQAHAEQLVLEGRSRRVELQVPARLRGIEPTLEGLGYRGAWENIELALELAIPRRRARHSVPDGAVWQDLDRETAESSHGCYQRAFRAVPGTQVPSLADYLRIMPPLEPRQRVLVHEGRVLAFVRAGWKSEADAIGEILSLGRDPEVALPGLGALALGEGVRVLQALGARRVELTVAARNLLARGLYAAFGFGEKARHAVLQKALEDAVKPAR